MTRPPRPASAALTDLVRRAILHRVHEDIDLGAHAVLTNHAAAEFVAGIDDLLDVIEQRYALAPGSIKQRALRRLAGHALGEIADGTGTVQGSGRISTVRVPADAERDACFTLLELPDPEFLTAIEHAVTAHVADRRGLMTLAKITRLSRYIDDALRAHGTPYRCSNPLRVSFEWIGDAAQHRFTVQPALLALDDPRLPGPRAEFQEALRKRRLGTPKDLEDAVDEAAKAIESTLQVLHDEHGVDEPRSRQVTPQFASLVAAGVLPGYVDKLVAACAGPRNNMASHGQGATVREVPEELADASIAAAATAITLLAHYLP